MSGVDTAPSSSLSSHHDSSTDILDHDLLSPSHHAVLPSHDHQVALELDLTCLAQSDTALEDPAAHMALQHSRDHIFGDIDHVGDHVKDDHITMVEAVDPAVTQQDCQQQSPESSLELKRVKVSFSPLSHLVRAIRPIPAPALPSYSQCQSRYTCNVFNSFEKLLLLSKLPTCPSCSLLPRHLHDLIKRLL